MHSRCTVKKTTPSAEAMLVPESSAPAAYENNEKMLVSGRLALHYDSTGLRWGLGTSTFKSSPLAYAQGRDAPLGWAVPCLAGWAGSSLVSGLRCSLDAALQT